MTMLIGVVWILRCLERYLWRDGGDEFKGALSCMFVIVNGRAGNGFEVSGGLR